MSQKLDATIYDSRMGLVTGKIRYYRGCFNDRVKFFEYGATGWYYLDPNTVECAIIEGIGFFRRFQATDNKKIFLRVVYQGTPFILYEHTDQKLNYFYCFDDSTNKIELLNYEPKFTDDFETPAYFVAACQNQLYALAHRQGVTLPKEMMEKLYYDQQSLTIVMHFLNNDSSTKDCGKPN